MLPRSQVDSPRLAGRQLRIEFREGTFLVVPLAIRPAVYCNGEIVVVDAVDDPETGEKVIEFRTIEGFTPPPMELAETGSD